MTSKYKRNAFKNSITAEIDEFFLVFSKIRVIYRTFLQIVIFWQQPSSKFSLTDISSLLSTVSNIELFSYM